MTVTDPFGRQCPVGDEANHCRAADSEQISRLLAGQLHRLRCDGDGLAGVQCGHHLLQGLVHCRRQLDSVMLVDTNEGITRRRCRAPETLMGGKEPNDETKLFALFWDEGRRLHRFYAHYKPLSERTETNFEMFE